MPSSLLVKAVGGALLAVAFGLQTSAQGRVVMEAVPSFGWAGLPTEFCSSEEVALYWIRGLFKNVLELSKGLIFLLLCCPRSGGPMARLGRHSIYPYLLHPIALEWCGPLLNVTPPACQLLVLPLAVTVLLASWPVRLVFGIFLEPRWLERLLAADERSGKSE